MQQESKVVSEKQLASIHHEGNHESVSVIQPRSKLFRLIYKSFKYGTLLTVILFIVLSGISILGDTSVEVQGSRRVFEVYKKSEEFTHIVDKINNVFEKESSKYISNKVINLYLHNEGDDVSENIKQNGRFDDLRILSGYLLSQRYSNGNVLYLPLNLNEQQGESIIPQSYSYKLLHTLRKSVHRFLQKQKIIRPQQVKQLRWSRVKKHIDNGKMSQVIQLIKQNIIDGIWQWVNESASVVVLENIDDLSKITTSNNKNKKLLNKWVRDNDQNSQIIILSRYPINKLYDIKDEDHFKSIQVQVSINSIDQQQLCKLLTSSNNNINININTIKSQNCHTLKQKFTSLTQLQEYIENNCQQTQPLSSSGLLSYEEESQQAQKLLKQVCTKGNLKHYFYQNQQNANKVLTKSKKGKKSRLDRELQALIVKWSHLKKAMGIYRIRDIILTMATTIRGYKEGLSLREMNELGLVYDFDLNELTWRDEEHKLQYQLRTGSVCNGGRVVVDDDGEVSEQVHQKNEHLDEDNEKRVSDDEQVQVQDEQQQGQQQQNIGQEQQQEYEQNFINRNQADQQENNQKQGQEQQEENNENYQQGQEDEGVVADEQVQEEQQVQETQQLVDDDNTQQIDEEQEQQLQNQGQTQQEQGQQQQQQQQLEQIVQATKQQEEQTQQEQQQQQQQEQQLEQQQQQELEQQQQQAEQVDVQTQQEQQQQQEQEEQQVNVQVEGELNQETNQVNSEEQLIDTPSDEQQVGSQQTQQQQAATQLVDQSLQQQQQEQQDQSLQQQEQSLQQQEQSLQQQEQL